VRVATIDIGTNSVLLLIATRRDGELVAIDERATITRLGQGVDETRQLAPEAIARTNACIDAYADVVRTAGVTRIDVVGTSAMRDARGGEAVRAHVRARLGVDARVVSGDEEARLTFLGALSGLDAAPGDVVVFDIGGGSTEIVRGERTGDGARIAYAHSFDVGSVRLTERHFRGDPPSTAEMAAARADVRAVFGDLRAAVGGAEAVVPVGIAGTMTTLAAVELGLATYDGARVHGHTMSRRALEGVAARLAAAPLEARRRVTGMEPKRADVIVAGALLALETVAGLGVEQVRVSDRGVRWGLAEELARGT